MLVNRKSLRVWALVALSFLVLAGCGLASEDEPVNLTPPNTVEWDEDVKLDQPAEQKDAPSQNGTDENKNQAASNVATTTLTLYFLDKNGYVVPVAMKVPKVEGIAQQALHFMTKGGPGEELLPEGFSAVLPPNTEVSVHIKRDEKLAKVDFSKEFKNVQSGQEKKVLEAVTYTLTQFPDVEKVEITVNGYPLTELGNYPVTQPLKRETLGLNLELSDEAQPGRTTAVTLYFQGVNQAGDSYLVPVTRLVPMVTEPKAKALRTLKELVRGPEEDSGLTPSLMQTLKVLDVDLQKETVIANLDEHFLSYLSLTEPTELSPSLESLVLTLTENTGAKQVQVLVNGKEAVTVNGKPLNKPLTRPAWVNPI